MQPTQNWLHRGRTLSQTLFQQLRSAVAAPPVRVQPTGWSVGLGIEPTEFSHQLARLQLSLALEAQKKTPQFPIPAEKPHLGINQTAN